MIQLFSLPNRNYVNETLDSGNILLSEWVDMPTCGGILLRLEIIAIDPGEQVTFAYTMFNGADFRGGETIIYTAPAKEQVNFGRGDFDNSTIIRLVLTITGRVRLAGTAYSVAQGEDVPEWL